MVLSIMSQSRTVHKLSRDKWLQSLPYTVAELVDNAPSLSKDGALLFGSRHTTVFMVDAASGELVRAFAEVGGALAEVEAPAGRAVSIAGACAAICFAHAVQEVILSALVIHNWQICNNRLSDTIKLLL